LRLCHPRLFASQCQRGDDQEIEKIGHEPSSESRRILAEMIVEDAGEPSSDRHAPAAAQQQCRHAPIGLLDGKELARGQYAGTRPLNPKPNSAETVNNPASSWVNRNAIMPAA
jgi:hypothetical protein